MLQAPVSDYWSETMSAIVLQFPAMERPPNRIRELRLAAGLSQEELAGLCGCSKMQISGLERGRPRLDIAWMVRIAPWLHVSPGELLNQGDNPLVPQNDYERRLLEIFRKAGPDEQGRILAVGEALGTYCAGNKGQAA
jgi:transcriptional regulator with XRE-family HTH domain